MPWYDYVAHFCAGVLLANGVPHFVQGICGNKFQTPFSSPRGVGESSALVNVLWGWLNVIVGIALLRIFLPPLPPPPGTTAATGLGVLAMAAWLANHFAKVRKGAPHP